MSGAGRQIELPLDGPPRNAEELLARLRALGLRDTDRLALTSNRTTMVSFRGRELRVHRGYLAAPREVHAAIVRFVQGRTRALRQTARRVIIGYEVPPELSRPKRPRRPSPIAERDIEIFAKLDGHHERLNALHFGGELSAIEIRLSDRMRSRLGHYQVGSADTPPHIAISRRHLKRNGWTEVVNTLLHEMVHQWQSERGLKVDHGRQFRAKARSVGLAEGSSRRGLPSAERRGRAPSRLPSPSPLQSLLFWR